MALGRSWGWAWAWACLAGCAEGWVCRGLGVQEGWGDGTLTLGDLRVLQRHADAIAKALRGECPAFPHSQAFPVPAGGGQQQPWALPSQGRVGSAMLKGRSSESPWGQLDSLFPAAQLGRLVARGQRGRSGLLGWPCPLTRGQDPGIQEEPERPSHPTSSREEGPTRQARPPGTPLGSGRGTGRGTQKCGSCCKGKSQVGWQVVLGCRLGQALLTRRG